MAELRTGWEPDSPDEDMLLRQALYNFTDFNVGVSETLGARVSRSDELALADLGRPGGFMNNATFLRPSAPERWADLADEIESFFGESGSGPVDIWSAWPTPDFRVRGWELGGHPPLMIRVPDGEAPTAAVDIREVTNASELEEFEAVLSTSFGNPDAPSSLDERILGLEDVRMWVGYVDGRAVCTSAVCASRGVNGVQTVATLPEYRGKGLGEAMTWQATMAEPSRPAVLLASDLGRSVYERMGYVAILRFSYWKLPREE